MSDFLNDPFTSVANGADLSTSTGATWTKNTNSGSFNDALIASSNSTGVRSNGGGSGNALYADQSHTPPNPNYTITAALLVKSLAGNEILFLGRAAGNFGNPIATAGSVNGYAVGYRPFHGVQLFRVDASALTVLGTLNAGDPSVGATLNCTLTMSGTTISATVSGGLSGSASATDATYSAAGLVGLFATGGASTDTTGVHYSSISAAAASFAQAAVADPNSVNKASASTYDFGTVNQGQAASAVFTLTNSGSGTALSVGTITASGSASISGDNASSTSINPSGGAAPTSEAFTVSLNTASAGTITGAISIPSNDTATPFTLNYTANVVVPTAPSTPTISASATSSTAIRVTWNPTSPNQTSYVLQRSPDNATWAQIATPTQTATTYLDTGLTQATTYYYQIQAVNGIGSSSFSGSASATTPIPGAPLPPTNLVATAQTDTDVNLMWDLADATDTYVVLQRSSDGGTTWSDIHPFADIYGTAARIGGGEATFNDPSCLPATAYQYRVAGANAFGVGPFSATATVATPASYATAAKPTAIALTALDPYSIQVKWTGSGNGYTAIERSLDGVNYQIAFTAFLGNLTADTANPNYWVDRYLSGGANVTYRMREAGNTRSDYTTPVSVTLPAPAAGLPLTPGNTLCTNTYAVSVGAASAGSFTLTLNTVDCARQPVSATTGLIGLGASTSQVLSLINATGILPYGSSCVVAKSGNNYTIGFLDGFTSLVAGTSSLTGGSLSVVECATATTCTVVFGDSASNAGTTYHVETAPYVQPFDYALSHTGTGNLPFTFTDIGTVAHGSDNALAFTLTTTAETCYYVRVRGVNANGNGAYVPHVRYVSPSSGPAQTVDCGPNQSVTTPVGFDWRGTNIGPGSKIRIHAKVAGGAIDKWTNIGIIPSFRGTPGNPIKIVGVPLLYFTNSPTGGTFRLTVITKSGSFQTGTIAWNATIATVASSVQAALAALSNVGGGNVTATSNAAGTIDILLSDAIGAAFITADGSSLTGAGAQPTAVVAQPIFDGSSGATIDNVTVANQFHPYDLSGAPSFEGHIFTSVRRTGQAAGYVSGYYTISNLKLANAANSSGVSYQGWNSGGSYVAGLVYQPASCGFYGASFDYVTLDRLTITGNGEGIFFAGGGGNLKPTCDSRACTYMTVQFCNISGNGNNGSASEHNSYGEGLYTVYVGNVYGVMKAGATGAHGMKDRGLLPVALCNDFQDGVNQSLDWVETQNYAAVIMPSPDYQMSVAQGNRYIRTVLDGPYIHVAGDHGNTWANRKSIHYSCHETFDENVSTYLSYGFYKNTDSSTTADDPVAVVDARNNIYFNNQAASGSTMGLMTRNGTSSACIGYFGTNWRSSTVVDGGNTHPVKFINTSKVFISGGVAGNAPGFTNFAAGDFHLTSGSPCKDQATRLPANILARFPLKYQMRGDGIPLVVPRTQIGVASDLGAFEYNNGSGSISVSPTSVERGAGFTLTVTGVNSNFVNGSFTATAPDGSTVTLTTNTAASGTSGTAAGTAPTSTGIMVLTDTTDSFAIPVPVIDTTAPTLTSATVNSAGTTLTLVFSEPVQGVNGSDYTLAGIHARTLGPATGSGTSTSFPLSPIGYQSETYTLTYNGTRTTDMSSNPLPVSTTSVTNNSTIAADYVAPSVPGGIVLTPGEGSIALSWSPSTKAGGSVASYNVRRGGVLRGTPSVTTFTDSGLISGTSYSYTVSAVDNHANESAQSGSSSATAGYPAAPSGGAASTASATISWSAVSVVNTPVTYTVEYSDNSGASWTFLTSANGISGLSAVDGGYLSGRKYRVKARDSVGNLTQAPATLAISGSGAAAAQFFGSSIF